jgi:ribosome biogenesis GTPase
LKKTKGTVYKSTGSWYKVKTDDGDWVDCRVKGKFRLQGFKLTNPVAVGDEVIISWEKENEGNIDEIGKRKNYVIRQSPRKKHYLHLLAANIDQAILVTTIIQPSLKPGFIDRFLLMTETYNIPVILVFNKCDLWKKKDEAVFQKFAQIYSNIGYDVLRTSAISSEGISNLQQKVLHKTSLISGHSGVGKSTLINQLHPEADIRTKEISNFSGKGQHTTTFAEMFDLPNGSRIIDTPGIKTLGFNHFEIMDVAHNFKEFFQRSSACKFNNCMHLNEPKCAVREAVKTGEIASSRYKNFLQIVEDIENQNYWEINKDW